jgi:Arc/MetJ-type ribon-helix-helix transcriptional regulator
MAIPEKRNVAIPSGLYIRVEQAVQDSNGEFKSVDDYVTFVLEELLADGQSGKQPMTGEEEAEVKKRLKALGYMQ